MKSQSIDDQFCYLLRVRYGECDAQAIVFNARYAEYIDVAITEFMRVVWKGGFQELVKEGYDTHVVSLHIDWKAPATFDEVLCLAVRMNKIGNTSFSIVVEFFNEITEQLLATGEVTYVMIKTDTHEKCRIPDRYREMMNVAVTGLVNHAGEIL